MGWLISFSWTGLDVCTLFWAANGEVSIRGRLSHLQSAAKLIKFGRGAGGRLGATASSKLSSSLKFSFLESFREANAFVRAFCRKLEAREGFTPIIGLLLGVSVEACRRVLWAE